ncbi:MAG: flavodoxin [Coriobacteriales bacterium]|jgi:menaquinone-dependent protoporphyrinogen IX oxidase
MSSSNSRHSNSGVSQSGISRRSLVAGAIGVAAVASVAGVLAAHASADANEAATSADGQSRAADASSGTTGRSASAGASAGSSAGDASASSAAQGGAGNVLVAYFSATGHTEAIAQAIADQLGAPTFSLSPTTPYATADLDYNDSSSRVSTEVGQRDTIDVALDQVTPEGWDSYDTVFVGYPIWWQDFSWVMGEFLTGNDFTGKTVIPFCTSAASPLGESAEHAAEAAGTGDWLDGRRFEIGASQDEVTDWLDGIRL